MSNLRLVDNNFAPVPINYKAVPTAILPVDSAIVDFAHVTKTSLPAIYRGEKALRMDSEGKLYVQNTTKNISGFFASLKLRFLNWIERCSKEGFFTKDRTTQEIITRLFSSLDDGITSLAIRLKNLEAMKESAIAQGQEPSDILGAEIESIRAELVNLRDNVLPEFRVFVDSATTGREGNSKLYLEGLGIADAMESHLTALTRITYKFKSKNGKVNAQKVTKDAITKAFSDAEKYAYSKVDIVAARKHFDEARRLGVEQRGVNRAGTQLRRLGKKASETVRQRHIAEAQRKQREEQEKLDRLNREEELTAAKKRAAEAERQAKEKQETAQAVAIAVANAPNEPRIHGVGSESQKAGDREDLSGFGSAPIETNEEPGFLAKCKAAVANLVSSKKPVAEAVEEVSAPAAPKGRPVAEVFPVVGQLLPADNLQKHAFVMVVSKDQKVRATGLATLQMELMKIEAGLQAIDASPKEDSRFDPKKPKGIEKTEALIQVADHLKVIDIQLRALKVAAFEKEIGKLQSKIRSIKLGHHNLNYSKVKNL